MPTLLLSAGDVSGDLHGAALVRTLLARRPDCRCVGLGGSAMRAAGVELIAHQREIAVGGIVELLGGAFRLNRVWRRMTGALERVDPDLVVLIDSGGFNLPLARRVRARTSAPILYYIAPQVWAWRRRRIRKLAERVDRLAVILPFEPELYVDAPVRVDFVGHPLVDALARHRAAGAGETLRSRAGLEAHETLIALMPGSRRNEISQHLPIQLESARLIHARRPEIVFALAVAPSLEVGHVEAMIRSASLPASMRVAVIRGDSLDVLGAARVALVKPGTVTVEAMLLGCPMVVMGRANPLTAWIVRHTIRVPWLAMPNLIAGRAIVPELLQEAASPEAISAALIDLLDGPARTRQLSELAAAAQGLGAGGASEAASKIAEEMLVS